MGDNEDRGWGEDEDCDEGGMGVRVRKGVISCKLFALETRLLSLKFIPTPVEHLFGYLVVICLFLKFNLLNSFAHF